MIPPVLECRCAVARDALRGEVASGRGSGRAGNGRTPCGALAALSHEGTLSHG